jgi:hypothetical protein
MGQNSTHDRTEDREQDDRLAERAPPAMAEVCG